MRSTAVISDGLLQTSSLGDVREQGVPGLLLPSVQVGLLCVGHSEGGWGWGWGRGWGWGGPRHLVLLISASSTTPLLLELYLKKLLTVQVQRQEIILPLNS